jgi:Peptidase A4 family
LSPFRRPAFAAATAFALISAAGLAASATAPAAATAISLHPMIPSGASVPFFLGHGGGVRPDTTVTSTNWAGYAVYGSVYTSVSTIFTQPAVKCSSGDQYSSFWVGLDGYSSDSVEQTGTEADCDGRTAEYSVWYELYPAYPVTYSNTVKPGDVITETISFSAPSTYTMTVKDSTENWTKTTTKSASGDARSSAEVIVEAPYDGSVLPLADFGTVSFSQPTVDGSSLCALNPTQIDMSDATVSPCINGFSVTWK